MEASSKSQGINQVIQNHYQDYLSLRSFAEKWIASRKGEFTFEDIKTDYLKYNPSVTDNLNGGVMAKLAEAGLVSYVRHEKAKLPNAHSRMIGVWKPVIIQKMVFHQVEKHGQIAMF